MQTLRRSKKILFISHWKAAEVLVSLKDMTVYLKTYSEYRKLFFICSLLQSVLDDMYDGGWFLYRCISCRMS